MPTTRTWGTQPYPRAEGNVALANECLSVRQAPKATRRVPQLRLVRDMTEEVGEIEALAPTIGMINGIRLSLTLWSLILLFILLMR